jgi:hypothetical protein
MVMINFTIVPANYGKLFMKRAIRSLVIELCAHALEVMPCVLGLRPPT